MKKLLILIILGCCLTTFAQEKNWQGAYSAKDKDVNKLILLTGEYASIVDYKNDTYLSTYGGPYRLNGSEMIITLEYSDKYPDSVGLQKIIPIEAITNDTFKAEGLIIKKLVPNNQELDGLWRITGRQSGDKINTIPRGDRKTIKILVDGYFQWIAINPAEKGFYGTGGGKYSFKNNKYTENIVFFSRDNTRVGNALNFDGSIKNKEWHHKGKSSKGDPIYEIWSKE